MQQSDRAKWFAGQVRKLSKGVQEVERLIQQTEVGLEEMAKAPVVSLPVYRDILRALDMNRKTLATARDELRKAEIMLQAENNAAPRQEVVREAAVLPFRRKDG